MKHEYSERSKEQFRVQLKKVIGKKFLTTAINALSQMEASFGQIWGHGKDYDSLTDTERENRDKWEDCRENILNVANRQRRNSSAEIEGFEIIKRHHTAILYPVKTPVADDNIGNN